MDYKGKKVMVVGMAASGISAAKLLLEKQAQVVLYDGKPIENFELGELKEQCECVFGVDPTDRIAEMDALVLSPGVPTRLGFIQKAYELGKEVIAEIELGYQCSPADFVCISGTNGKTTTTALTGEIFRNAGKNTFVLGNIGTPICENAMDTKEGDVVVAETAALQLETTTTFRPRACALLNLTEDHMDRFLTMEYYTACKMKMFANQQEGDFAVFNYDDLPTREESKKIDKAAVIYFSRKEKVKGAFVEDGCIVFNDGVRSAVICPAEEVRIPGPHNLENALAATALAMVMGIEPQVIAETLRTFAGVEHRLEYVRTLNGIEYINDSKGTNPDSTIKAIQTMKRPTVIILGGYDKHSDFMPMFEEFTDYITGIVILGVTKEKIRECAEKVGFKNYALVDTFEEAILRARDMCEENGTVLLSPACASWDMFKNFEQRGEIFKEFVNNLE